MRIVVINHITLDGVMQSPGRADEDTRGGFSQGGWAIRGSDDAVIQAVGERMTGALLLGRRSYEEMLASWNKQGGPYKDALNAATKHVVWSSSATRLEWPSSVLVHGDITAGVAELR